MLKKLLALSLVAFMLFSVAACSSNKPSTSDKGNILSDVQSGTGASESTNEESSDGASESADTESGEPLVLPLYNRFYLNDDELVLVKDDGSVVIDFGEGYEDDSAEVREQIDATGKKWAGVIKASVLDRCVWLISTDRQLYEITNKRATVLKENVVGFSYDDYTTILVYGDGTVEHIGERSERYPDISGIEEWTDIVQVAHGYTVALGLKKDGTVVAVGGNSKGQADVSGWTDIVQIAVFDSVSTMDLEEMEGFSVGLKSDGTLVATGKYFYGSDISGLLDITDVKQIARERENVVLLKNDGTVVSHPGTEFLRTSFEGVKDIAAIGFEWDVRQNYIYVKEDGTIVIAPDFITVGSGVELSMK